MPKTKKAPVCHKVMRSLINDVWGAMKSMIILPKSTKIPSWIKNPERYPPAEEMLTCQNTLIHLPSLAAGKPDYRWKLTPNFFNFVALPFHFDPGAGPPVLWMKFLRELWPNDPQSINTLQEWLGHLLLPDTSQQKILLLLTVIRI
jgi:putative DNA primase/helicase